MFEGMVVFVCVDSDENTYFMIADEAAVEQWWIDNPDGDRFACANEIGRSTTPEEDRQLSFIEGCLAY